MSDNTEFCLCKNCIYFSPLVCNNYFGECMIDDHHTVSICRACENWKEGKDE